MLFVSGPSKTLNNLELSRVSPRDVDKQSTADGVVMRFVSYHINLIKYCGLCVNFRKTVQ